MATPSFAGVHVRDADTLVLDGTPVRLQGVDAPALKHRGGQGTGRATLDGELSPGKRDKL